MNLDGDLEDEMPPWWESHVAVPGVEEVLEQLEELLLPGDVRRKHHRADKVRKLRELGVSEVPDKKWESPFEKTAVKKLSKVR